MGLTGQPASLKQQGKVRETLSFKKWLLLVEQCLGLTSGLYTYLFIILRIEHRASYMLGNTLPLSFNPGPSKDDFCLPDKRITKSGEFLRLANHE